MWQSDGWTDRQTDGRADRSVLRAAWSQLKRTTCTVRCRYNAVQYNMTMHTSLQWARQNLNQGLQSQKTPHISASRASHGIAIVSIFKKTDRVIMTPHCISETRHDSIVYLSLTEITCLFLFGYHIFCVTISRRGPDIEHFFIYHLRPYNRRLSNYGKFDFCNG